MKKNKLKVALDFEFDLMGILSQSPEYKLAWSINKQLGINMVRAEEAKIEFINNNDLLISYYIFETENSLLRLIKNRSHEGGATFLLPEIKQIDFFLQIYNHSGAFDSNYIFSTLAKNSEIQFITKIELGKLKSKENLIF